MKKIIKQLIFTIFAVGIIVSVLNGMLYSVRVHANEIKNKKSGEYIIAQDGTGDFLTIQEGVKSARDGDTLIIYPGIYNESVEIISKDINLRGIDKDTCIIQCDTASYRKSPLTIGAGEVSNLTLYGIYSGIEQEELSEEEIALINSQMIGDTWERQKNFSGYTIHADQNYLYRNDIKFINCRIISENNYCVGVGSRGMSSIIFEGCELISLGSGGCVFLHDCILKRLCGKANFVMKNCQLTSYLSPYILSIHSLRPENTTYLTFQNVKVNAVAYENRKLYNVINMNTSFEVDILSVLDKTGQLKNAGFKSTVMNNIVHELTYDESNAHIKKVEKCVEEKDMRSLFLSPLPEGITYLTYKKDLNPNEQVLDITNNAKRHIISIYNENGTIGNGWCGLNNTYLTAESYGNTLIEMNFQ